MLILAVLGFTVIFLAGAIAIDIGLWLSERRGAQTDADFSALTGAWELLDPGSGASDAVSAATTALNANDEQANASLAQPIVVDNSCFGVWENDAVTVDVDHKTRSLFASIFNTAAPVPGAHAKACAGATNGPSNIVPFQIDNAPGPCFDPNRKPILTAMCGLELGSQSDNPRGMLDLDAPDGHCSDGQGSADIAKLIEDGVPGTCLINATGTCDPATNGPWDDCVAVQTGNPKGVLNGTHDRIAKDGQCDSLSEGGNGDGTDDFSETVQLVFGNGDPSSSYYEPQDCDTGLDAPGLQMSPRLITIIVLEYDPPAGNEGHPIFAFAAFYIAGCAPDGQIVNSEADLDRDCDNPPNNMNQPAASGLYVMDPQNGPLPGPLACHRGTPHGGNLCPTPTPAGTPTPTPTPAPTPAPTPTPTPPDPGPPGHVVIYGRFMQLILAGSGVGPPNSSSTSFSIALVE